MRYWKECYNSYKEQFLVAPVWVRLFALPINFWDLEILEGIGNSIRRFVKITNFTQRGRYASYVCICVYMNILKPLLESVKLEYQEEVWQQPLDYEHILFCCCCCHEYGHPYKACSLNQPSMEELKLSQEQITPQDKNEGFKEVPYKKKNAKGQ